MVNCTSAWFFSPIPPPHPPLIKDTLTYRQTLVSPTPHPFLPIPLPCQHKPVMWLSQIMRWEFYCTSLWGWQQLRLMHRSPWYQAPSADSCGLAPDTDSFPQVLQQCTSKWEIKGWLAHDSQRMTMAQPGYTYCYVPVTETQRLPRRCAAWRKSSFRKGDFHT